MKKFKDLKVNQLKKISNRDSNEITQLIIRENPHSILASLPKDIIKNYIQKVATSNDILIFVLQKNKKIIAYAIIAKKIEKLMSIFFDMKVKVFLSLFFNLKFIKLINIILAYTKIDLLFLKRKYIRIINSNFNLNLLAVVKKYQSQGLGSYFLKKIFYSIRDSNYITVEAIDERAVNFYKKKLNFKFVGNKIRFTKKLRVLCKKIT